MKTLATTVFPLSFVASHELLGKKREDDSTAKWIGWPMIDLNGIEISAPIAKVYKDAFLAILHLEPFAIQISGIQPDEKNCRLILCGKVWGVISLQGREVMRFDYYTNPENTSLWEFQSILEWLRICPQVMKQNLQDDQNQDEIKKIFAWSSVQNWIYFFREVLSQRSLQIIKQGKQILETIQKQQIIL
jgi:hypothetical protein